MRRLLLPGLVVVALVLSACGGGGSSNSDGTNPTSESSSVDSGESVWYALDGETGTQYDLVESADGSYELGPDEESDTSNLDAAQAAQTVMEEYLLTAWELPFRQNLTDRDAIADWTNILSADADPRWGPGPTWIDFMAKDQPRPAGDLRGAWWGGVPSAQPDTQWHTGVEYEYQIAKYYGRITKANGNISPMVFIERSPAGALRSVYLLWGVETGYRITGVAPGSPYAQFPRLVMLNYGFAQFVPSGASEVTLDLLTPDYRDPLPGGLKPGLWTVNSNLDGRFNAQNPAFVKPEGISSPN